MNPNTPDDLRTLLETHIAEGALPGAVALIARGDRVEVRAAGSLDTAGTAPMARDSIFRIASLTKPVVAAAAMMLIEDGRIAPDDPVDDLLPELADRSVVRTPTAAIDDVVPADRPITVFDLLTFRAGYGFPSDFSLPALAPLMEKLGQGPPQPQQVPAPDEWMARLSDIPLLHQPGEAWLYNTCSDILGVLIARAAGRPLPEFLAERLFEPLAMVDTGFAVPPADLGRFTTCHLADPDGTLRALDGPTGQWSTPPAFPSGGGGLVSTVDDYHAFARLLLAEGTVAGRRLLSPESIRRMTTNHLTPAQRKATDLFLEGQGWGFGGSVDIEAVNAWNVPGRYGWVGGTGTTAHIVPATGSTAILFTQVQLAGPTPPAVMRAFWELAAHT
ncbi:serine hydrolase domain-containing protein [Embleya sp. MST-111070]|uniref:serine hydrolase domain-containing protein n=1 Tax=Embleya sp. MST-111070 TaxID=3398231 RepID=UPI003F740A57